MSRNGTVVDIDTLLPTGIRENVGLAEVFARARLGDLFGAIDQAMARLEEGTLDPKDMAIAEASNLSDAGLHYASWSMDTMQAAAARLRQVVTQIEGTTSAKEALDLNSYARAEVTRMAIIKSRLKAVRQKIDTARYALLLQAYADDEEFLRVSLED